MPLSFALLSGSGFLVQAQGLVPGLGGSFQVYDLPDRCAGGRSSSRLSSEDHAQFIEELIARYALEAANGDRDQDSCFRNAQALVQVYRQHKKAVFEANVDPTDLGSKAHQKFQSSLAELKLPGESLCPKPLVDQFETLKTCLIQ